MAPKTATAAGTDDGDSTFSPKEMTVLALAWQCLEGDAKVDTKKLAKLAGYTEGSASVIWGKIRRKLKNVADGTEKKEGSEEDGKTAEDGTPTTPKTPASRKRKGKNVSVEGEETPMKKSRTPRKKAEVKPEAKQEDVSGGEADTEMDAENGAGIADLLMKSEHGDE